MTKIIPVIVSGGHGTRLWPLSRAVMPKQFIPLLAGDSLFSLTLSRVNQRDIFTAPIIVCSKAHSLHVAEILKVHNITDAIIISEPVGRNTAPAFCAGLLAAQDIDANAPCLMLPADHYIPDAAAFRDVVQSATLLVEGGQIITFGITPRSPHTGYGYIQKGESVQTGFRVQSFKEKPDAAKAATYLESGDYYWNSGIFMLRPDHVFDILKELQPDIYHCVEASWKLRHQDLVDVVLDPDSFSKAPNISFDYAVMENTKTACVVPASFIWDDLGSWDALWDIAPKDDNNNVIDGDVIATDTNNSYLSSSKKLLCVAGVSDIIVIATEDSILVTPRGKPDNMSGLVQELKKRHRTELDENVKVYRPWGSYEIIEEQAGFKVKRIKVTSGHKLSLQKHQHRSEHWVVVKGVAHVTKGSDSFDLNTNESVYIPCGTIHRLENRQEDELEIVEVQTGSYLGEDDITRIEDDYSRVSTLTFNKGI